MNGAAMLARLKIYWAKAGARLEARDGDARYLLYSLLISLVVHVALLFTLPGFAMGSFSPPRKYTEVKLLYIPPKPVKTVARVGKPKRKPKPEPKPALKPQLNKEGDFLTEELIPLSDPAYHEGEIPALKPPGEVPERDLTGVLPETELAMNDIVLPASTPLNIAANTVSGERRPVFGGAESFSPMPSLPNQIGIEWSGGAPRRPVSHPPSPEYRSRVEGEVRLKFWVSPSGKVTNVVVMKKLDAELERISMEYFKQWVFEPLPPGAEQKYQSGTVSIRFKLQ